MRTLSPLRSLTRLVASAIVLVALALVLGAPPTHAAGPVCTVGASGAIYTTIQAAVNDTSCFTINVAAGTYREHLTIVRDVTINGAGAGATIVERNTSIPNCCTIFRIEQPVTVTLNGLTIRNGFGQSGAGIFISDGNANVTVRNSMIANNWAPYPSFGGGIYSQGKLTVSDSTFTDNRGGRGGGGIFAVRDLTVVNSTFAGNGNPGEPGSGIYAAGPTLISGSTFTGNVGAGALYIATAASAKITVINSTFSGNHPGGGYWGGAIYAKRQHDDKLEIISSTIVGNSASAGGGIFNDDMSVTIKNSIIANNGGYNCSNTPVSNGGNNLRWPSSDGSCVGTYGDPKLGPLADNGGPTQTMALLTGSAAIDRGSCTDVAGATVATDQRGASRPAGATCDIGAYESSGLAAHWKLDEGSGATAYDASGNGNHATLSQPTSWTAAHAPTPFNNPYAYQSGWTLNAPLVTTQVDNVSLTAWVRWDGGGGGNRFIFMNGNSASTGYGLIQKVDTNRLNLILAGRAYYDFGYTLPVNAWTHVALVRANGTWRLYVNGTQRGGTTTQAPATPTQGTYIGSSSQYERFSGQIDDVRIYNRALPQTEIKSWIACYTLKSQQTGFVADVSGGSTAPGSPLVIWPQNSPVTPSQLWTPTPEGILTNWATGYVLSVKDDSTAQGAGAVIAPQTTPLTSNQQWSIIPDARLIKNKQTLFLLDVRGGGTTQGTPIIVWPQNSPVSSNQLWTLVPSASCG